MTLRLQAIQRQVDGNMHLADIDLTLETGQLYVLLGVTGAGKTTLMRTMAGLDRPSGGKVLANNKDVTKTDIRKRDVAMVYQQFINYPSMTVYDNIASPLRLKKRADGEIDKAVRDAAKIVHIEKLLDRLPVELSGGQQQRCAIARALIKESSLLLLDEPLVNLDYKLREELRAELRELFKRRDAIVVYATTEPQEALIMGGEVIVMHEGRVLQKGPANSVFHNPNSTRVARIFSDPPMNTVDVRIQDDTAMAAKEFNLPLTGYLAGLGSVEGTLGIRANHLFLNKPRQPSIALNGIVELTEISGSETFVHIRHGESSWVVQEEGVHEHSIGDSLRFYLDPAELYLFDRQGVLQSAPSHRSVVGARV